MLCMSKIAYVRVALLSYVQYHERSTVPTAKGVVHISDVTSFD